MYRAPPFALEEKLVGILYRYRPNGTLDKGITIIVPQEPEQKSPHEPYIFGIGSYCLLHTKRTTPLADNEAKQKKNCPVGFGGACSRGIVGQKTRSPRASQAGHSLSMFLPAARKVARCEQGALR